LLLIRNWVAHPLASLWTEQAFGCHGEIIFEAAAEFLMALSTYKETSSTIDDNARKNLGPTALPATNKHNFVSIMWFQNCPNIHSLFAVKLRRRKNII
jgi:hypothetical protein